MENGRSYDYVPCVMLRQQWQKVVLKLILRCLSPTEKKTAQHLLQKAFAENEEGFYVYARKQTGDIKAQLGYIGRYIRRPAVAVSRIEDYAGQQCLNNRSCESVVEKCVRNTTKVLMDMNTESQIA
ncbi:hypothetical protein CBW46_017980 [Paenibacillus xerothermodurans]|uniref:Transposase IS801/IS1294 domain-containing protein n=1 Tax=Paenibacillus xerothermodurans TaxID=1977292 RepID=A0A2W1N700_PAEXE|nr:transposase [Paenibacillus xerothermodurans]PZE19604.1 hypothetical protein CBW46_017980 [Paenibacillus xerothermodurans]